MSRLVERSPEQLAAWLRDRGQRRAYLVLDAETGGYRCSPPELAEWAPRLADAQGGGAHEAVFLEAGRGGAALHAAFVHRTARGQAQGGLRLWPYASAGALLDDGLRLALGMTRKNALAGLWWGGGKGLVAPRGGDAPRDPEQRRDLFRDYGRFVSSLRGVYVTAEDVGTGPADVAEVFRTTRFVTCIPPEAGGSGNPSRTTAAGVVCAIEAALAFAGLGGIEGRCFVVQGTGHVGSALIGLLLERGAEHIVASEISADRRSALLDAYEGAPLTLRAAEPGDDAILGEPCDVLCPSALGGVIGPKTVPALQARIVCGPANNPLVDEVGDAGALAERGILYVPDFVANRMGIVSCANEQYGSLEPDPDVERHLDPDAPDGVHRTVSRVLARARDEGVTTVEAACELADERAAEPHPIWGHRTRRILDALVEEGWERG